MGQFEQGERAITRSFNDRNPNLNCSLFDTVHVKHTHREKAPPNKTPALRKSTNVGVWAVGTLKSIIYKRFLN